MPRRAIQLFVLLLAVAAGTTIAIYVWQTSKSSTALVLAEATSLPSGIASAPLSSATQRGAPQNNDLFIEAVSEDADNFNPIYSTNPTSRKVIEMIYPALVGQDPFTGTYNGSGLAEKWRFSDDGHTISFTLYPDLHWSDGAPLTAQDVAFTYALIREPTVASPFRPNFANVEAVEAVDDQTLTIHLAAAECTIFQSLQQPLVPAHLYNGTVDQFRQADPNQLPTVGAGPFLFADRSSDRILLRRNDRYRLGAPLLARYELQIMPDAAQQWAALDAGNIDLVHLSTEQLAQVQPSATTTLYKAPLDSMTFLALNLANPAHPQPGRAEDGSLLPQDPHPILGSLPVRQALAHAIDYDALLTAGFQQQIVRMDGYLLPTIRWVQDDQSTPYSYNSTLASDLLTDAGWTDENGDGIREKNGAPLQLTLLTNQDSPVRVHLAELLQTQLQTVGIDMRVEPLPFDLLTDELLGQQFDVVLIGWDTLGAEPANSDFWLSQQDLPPNYDITGIGGANFTSYQNVAVDLWLTEARRAPNCDGGYRAQRYRQVQERIREDLPYIVLGAPLQGWAYRNSWAGIIPQPWNFYQNIQRWRAGP